MLRRNPISESNAPLCHTYGSNVTQEYKENILMKLRSDLISIICKQDSLILQFGGMQYEKYANTQSELIRQSVSSFSKRAKRGGFPQNKFGKLSCPGKF